jgi:hypothetical protein
MYDPGKFLRAVPRLIAPDGAYQLVVAAQGRPTSYLVALGHIPD